jgi:hypothetical protein
MRKKKDSEKKEEIDSVDTNWSQGVYPPACWAKEGLEGR